MKVHESAENYLETILVLSHSNPHVRSIDIVNELGFSKPRCQRCHEKSSSKRLYYNGLRWFHQLTEKGTSIAEMIYERHTFISQWLIHLGVDKKQALDDACRIEHVISAESFAAIKTHVENHQKS